MAEANRSAAETAGPASAIGDQTAIKVTNGPVEEVHEGPLTPHPDAQPTNRHVPSRTHSHERRRCSARK